MVETKGESWRSNEQYQILNLKMLTFAYIPLLQRSVEVLSVYPQGFRLGSPSQSVFSVVSLLFYSISFCLLIYNLFYFFLKGGFFFPDNFICIHISTVDH